MFLKRNLLFLGIFLGAVVFCTETVVFALDVPVRQGPNQFIFHFPVRSVAVEFGGALSAFNRILSKTSSEVTLSETHDSKHFDWSKRVFAGQGVGRVTSFGEREAGSAKSMRADALSLFRVAQLILSGDLDLLSFKEVYGFDLWEVTISVQLKDGSIFNQLPVFYAPLFALNEEVGHGDWERLADQFESLTQILSAEFKGEKRWIDREDLVEFPELLDSSLVEKVHRVLRFDTADAFLIRSRERRHVHVLKFLDRLNARVIEKRLIGEGREFPARLRTVSDEFVEFFEDDLGDALKSPSFRAFFMTILTSDRVFPANEFRSYYHLIGELGKHVSQLRSRYELKCLSRSGVTEYLLTDYFRLLGGSYASFRLSRPADSEGIYPLIEGLREFFNFSGIREELLKTE